MAPIAQTTRMGALTSSLGQRPGRESLGAEYLSAVQRRLARFIRNVDAPASWDYIWRRSRAIGSDLAREDFPRRRP